MEKEEYNKTMFNMFVGLGWGFVVLSLKTLQLKYIILHHRLLQRPE